MRLLTMLMMLAVSIVAFGQVSPFDLMEEPVVNYFEVEQAGRLYFKDAYKGKGSGYKHFLRWLEDYRSMVDENGNVVPMSYYWQQAQDFKEAAASYKTSTVNTPWSDMGPFSTTPTSTWSSSQGGRIKACAIDPNDLNRIFVGSDYGSVWRTLDGGVTWTSLFDDMPTMKVRGIGLNPIAGSETVYVGTNGGGLFVSYNNGKTWHLDQNFGTTGIIKAIKYHPTDSTIIYVGSTYGLYRSQNSGQSWSQMSTYSVEDIEFKPNDPNTVYASGSVYLRSTNGGNSFFRITNGIPLTSRTQIAVTPANPEVVYLIQARGSAFGNLLKSTDGGSTFVTQIESQQIGTGTSYNWNLFAAGAPLSANYSGSGGQATHNMAVTVSPTNENEVLVAGVNTFKSMDGGVTWLPVTYWAIQNAQSHGWGFNHADVHGLIHTSPTQIFSYSDGGIYRSDDGGETWNDLSAGMSLRQYYRLGSCESDGEILAAGSQDNGSSVFNHGSWIDWLGADGMETIIHPTDPNKIIGTSQNGGMYRSLDGGQTRGGLGYVSENGAWVTPLLNHPTNDNGVFLGKEQVHRSDDFGDNWTQISNFSNTGTINDMAVAQSNANVMYITKSTLLYKTEDGGNNWSEVSTPVYGYIQDVQIDPVASNRVYVAINNSVYRSEDGGANWTDLKANLPDVPVYAIAVEYYQRAIYVGTLTGIYYTNDMMDHWVAMMNGMPNIWVRELEIHQGVGKIRAATYGRGLWEAELVPVSDYDCVSNFPYIQQFEAENNQGTHCGLSADLEAFGWYNPINDDDHDWLPFNGATPSDLTGPSSDHTGNGGHYLYAEASGNCVKGRTYLMSPCFDMSAMVEPRLSFWYHMNGADMGSLTLQASIDGGINWENLWTQSGSQGEQWLEAQLDLGAQFNGNPVVFRFQAALGDGGLSDIALDDFSIEELYEPSGVTVYFKRPDWSTVTPKIHYWGTSPDVGSSVWDGENMVDATNERGEGWFKYIVDGATTSNMLFHVNNGGTQGYKTDDLMGIAGGCYDMNQTAWVTCPELSDAPVLTITPQQGTCPLSVQCFVEDPNEDATIYYTLDGSIPNTSSDFVSDGTYIQIMDYLSLTVLAIDAEGNHSDTLTASCTLAPEGVEVYFKRPDWSNDIPKIHYWGTSPDVGSSQWDGVEMEDAAVEKGSGWFKYIVAGANSSNMLFHFNNGASGGYKTDDFTAIAGGCYDMNLPDWVACEQGESPPELSLNPTQGLCPLNVTASATDVDGGTIELFYTLDGTTPDDQSTALANGASLEIEEGEVLMVIAKDPEGNYSDVESATCTPPAEGVTVFFKRPAGNTNTPKIHYWGTMPDVGSSQWDGVDMVDASAQKGADWFTYTIAGANASNMLFHYNNGGAGGYKSSDQFSITDGCFDMDQNAWVGCNGQPPVAMLTPASGTCPLNVTASGSDPEGGAVALYYTLDGTDPDVNSTEITGGSQLTINSGDEFRLIAEDEDGNLSAIVSASCTDPIEGVTVYFKRPNWSGDVPKIHYWGTSPNVGSSTWDGEQMVDASSEYGADWFKYTVEGATSSNMLFHYNNGGSGGYKTGDQTGITDGCYDMNSDSWVTCPTPELPEGSIVTAVFGQEELRFGLYPNPAADQVQLQVKSADLTGLQLEIINALGQSVMMQSVDGRHTNIDLSNLSTGLYQVRLYGSGQSRTRNLMVK